MRYSNEHVRIGCNKKDREDDQREVEGTHEIVPSEMVSHLLSSCSYHHIPSVINQPTDEETSKVPIFVTNYWLILYEFKIYTSWIFKVGVCSSDC
jgi:hypothetical protein